MNAIDTPASPRRRPEQRGPMATRITEVAVELFYRQGYPQTSIREITSACGITPGAMYNHFSSKEELLWAIVGGTHRMTADAARDALAEAGGDPVEELRRLVRAMTIIHSTHRLSAIVSRNEARRLPEQHARQVLDSQREIRRTVERTLQQGFDAGVFHLRALDDGPAVVAVTAKAILDLCVHCGLWFRPDGPLDTEKLADTYVELVLQMVGRRHD